ncbi:MAG: hypothetical protein P1U36_10520 [Legionellaceae bacterium]|nr:hypothetical protein [Legionellaceae bacterium]
MPPENTRVLVCNLTLMFGILAILMHIDKSPFHQWGEEFFGHEQYIEKLNHSNLESEKIDLLIKLSKKRVYNSVDTSFAMLALALASFSTILMHETKLLHQPLPTKDTLTLMGHRLYSIFQPSSNIENDPEDCPHEFMCSISYEVMKKPVYSIKYPKLHRCDESSLLEWLKHHDRHPLLNDVPYVKQDWVEDTELKTQISDYFCSHKNTNAL